MYHQYWKARQFLQTHCVKSISIQSYSGPYSVQMRENTDQNNSAHRHFSEWLRQQQDTKNQHTESMVNDVFLILCGTKYSRMVRLKFVEDSL